MNSKRKGVLNILISDGPLFFLSLAFVVGMFLIFMRMYDLTYNIRTEMIKQNAVMLSEALEKFRTIYTSEVVNRVKSQGIEVAHDYKVKEGTIPLPVTLSMMLGQLIGQDQMHARTRLYSDYPFPWRRNEGGPQDDFEYEALKHLRQNPEQPFFRVEEVQGYSTFRYASADLMRYSCVKCHNTHPQSPKTDWAIGDVRGVLEVMLPMDASHVTITRNLKNTAILIVGVALIGLFLVFGIIKKCVE